MMKMTKNNEGENQPLLKIFYFCMANDNALPNDNIKKFNKTIDDL